MILLQSRLQSHSGFALFSSLVTLTLLMLLSSITYFRTNQDARIAHARTLHQHAFNYAERVLWESIESLNLYALDSLVPVSVFTTTVEKRSENILTNAKVTTTKVNPSLVWIVAHTTAQRGHRTAHHRLALSAKLVRANTSNDPSDSSLALVPIPNRAWVNLY